MTRRRLTTEIARAIIFANLIALVGITFGFAVSGLTDHEHRFGDEVEHIVAVFEDVVDRTADGRPTIDVSDRDWQEMIEDHPDLIYIVVDPVSDTFLGNDSGSLRRTLGERWLHEWRRSIFTLNLPGQPEMHGAISTIAMDREPLRVAIAYSDNSWRDVRNWVFSEFVDEIAPTAVPALLISLVLTLFAVRRAMQPVAEVAGKLSGLDPTRSDARLDPDSLPGEIAPLVAAVNDSFDRMADAFEHERRFIADAAHELKTPIAVLRARIDGLADRAGTERLSADVDRLAHVVERMLASVRIDNSRQALKPFDVAALARGIVAEHVELALTRGVEIALSVAPGPQSFVGDAEALSQALRNLLANAVRFSPAQGVVEVELTLDEAGRCLVLEVRDRGPGLPPGMAKQIFTPFVSTAPSGSGHAGLGLAIVAACARRHGGKAQAENRVGGGAIFRLILPNPVSVDPA